ncbi:hypothetical protein ACF5W4_13370 [Bacillota bacterium Lsc_1132]
MTSYVSKQQKLILLTVTLLLIAFALFLQFFYLGPAKAELTVKQKTLQMEQKLAETVAQKKTGTKQEINQNTRELQLKLPVKPLQEQFILDLLKVETLSNSEIKSMNFSSGNQAASQTAQAAEQANQKTGTIPQQQNGSSTTSSGASQKSANSEKQQPITSTPAGLNKLTVQLTVESPSYEEFEKFIKTLEGLKRLVVVETIQYAGTSETTAVHQGNGQFTYNLTVSAFYMGNLPDLEGDLPKIDTPEPAGKKNPLSQFPEVVNR